ncbi:MAG: M60 family metallopeptidase [Akkermansiaceae bacterium]|nr:M60 family metallopeptidase [Akkermansiaceae bacterium]
MISLQHFPSPLRVVRSHFLRQAFGWVALTWLASAPPAAAAANPEPAADRRTALESDLRYFRDSSASALADGVTRDDLAAFRSGELRAVAAAMLDGKHRPGCRIAAYEAYPSQNELSATLGLGAGFSRYEGITGMFLEEGEHVVLVGPTGGKRIELLIPDFMRQPTPGHRPDKDPQGWGLKRQQFGLREGVNLIRVEKSGNAYVSYYDDHAGEAPKITVHFPTGKENGYFDIARHDNADWDRLLDGAVSPVMDARGKHIQVAYPVEWFKVHTRGRGADLIRNYDTLLYHHYTFMGLVKYDKVPRNRILARVNHNYYMFRDGDGVAYLGTRGVMGMVANPDSVIKGDPCWGFSHEAGHVLQMRPQITWGGMTEVSVNLFSLYTMEKMGNPCRLKAQKNFASARRKIIEAEPGISYLQTPDVFDRLVPFWQLHLYFARHGRPDFYADVMEEMRRRPAPRGRGNDSIRSQFEFVKICCDVAKLDLTDFFRQWGFFWTGEMTVNDYGRHQFTITGEMVKETLDYVAGKNYPKPAEDLTRIES